MLGTGIHYSPRGSAVESSSYFAIFSSYSLTKIHFNYVDVPALLVIQPSTFRIFVGPQISFLTSSDIEGNDISEAIEGSSSGIRYGMGFEANASAFRITGQNGFTDVFKHPDEEWKTHAYTLSWGILC